VSSVIESGFFVEIGPLNAFVSRAVCWLHVRGQRVLNSVEMIPPYIKFDSKASPPQWTDNGDQVIEKGTHVRVKIKGTRNEMGQLFAIATINEVSLCLAVISRILTSIVGLPGVRLICLTAQIWY
jgi:DNA-directed RNA polymerase II subunit RPB7